MPYDKRAPRLVPPLDRATQLDTDVPSCVDGVALIAWTVAVAVAVAVVALTLMLFRRPPFALGRSTAANRQGSSELSAQRERCCKCRQPRREFSCPDSRRRSSSFAHRRSYTLV
jgi:hypothetical protein